VTARTVGLLIYDGMPKPGSTYGHSGNLAETMLAETDTGLKVILETFWHHTKIRSPCSQCGTESASLEADGYD